MQHPSRGNRRFRLGASLAAAALTLTGLVGCAPAAESSMHIALVIGAHANAPFVSPGLIEPYLDDLDSEGDRITVIVADGRPSVVLDETISDLPENSLDRRDALAELHVEVAETAGTAVADDPEVDTTEAIALASRSFGDGPERKRMVLIDSLVQTTGLFTMTNGGLYSSPRDRVAYVKEQGGMADLDGIAVEAPRLGLVEQPQQPLTSEAMNALRALWQEYFDAAQAASVDFSAPDLDQRPQSAVELPSVTPVDVERPTPPPASECRQVLGDNSIGFNGDESTFVDETAAASVIAAAADALRGCSGTVRVEGSTSSVGDQTVNVPLSEDRAHAVAEPLAAALGIPVDQIEVVGWGAEWPCRQPDRLDDGSLDPMAAQANRSVAIGRGRDIGHC